MEILHDADTFTGSVVVSPVLAMRKTPGHVDP